MCLTTEPEYDDVPKPSYQSFVYGTEYEYIGSHHDENVPCSVCRAPQSTTIMVPGTLTCPENWTPQYTGHLVAGYFNHVSATEYLCLDASPEDLDGGEKDDNGKLLYYTVTKCGSLHCPPYIADKVVTCVVCSM